MNAAGYGLYLLFICSWFLHLTARVEVLGALRFDMLLVVVLMLCSFGATDDPPAASSPLSKVLWILVGYALLTIPFVEWPGSVMSTGFPAFFRAFVFFYLTLAFVRTPERLRVTVCVFLACQTFRILEPLYLHLTDGYWGSYASMDNWEQMDRLSGAPSDVVNPNGLAFVILTTLPLLHYLLSGQAARRLLYFLLLPALIYTLLLTGSRSGLVGLAAILLLIWWKSPRKVLLACLLTAGVAIVMPLLSADMRDRYTSIWDSHTKNSGSAEGRWEGVQRDFRVAMRRPLFGHGLGTSREANANFGDHDQPSHSLYVEIAQELGGLGLVIFMAFVWVLASTLRTVTRQLREAYAAEIYEVKLVAGLQVWLGMNLLFSFAAFGLSGYEWYFAAGLTVVLERLCAAQTATAVERVAKPAAAPSSRPPSWPPLPSHAPLSS
jgi:O-antigen ligase